MSVKPDLSIPSDPTLKKKMVCAFCVLFKKMFVYPSVMKIVFCEALLFYLLWLGPLPLGIYICVWFVLGIKVQLFPSYEYQLTQYWIFHKTALCVLLLS